MMNSLKDASRTAWLFAGQSTQAIGMTRELCGAFPQVLPILKQAEEISGLPLLRLCWQNSSDLLERPDVLQPAATAIILSCLSLLEEEGHVPDCVAGHGLGEFAALCAAGVLSLEDTLYLVTCRGRLMHEAAQRRPGGMLSVEGLRTGKIHELMDSLRTRHPLYVAYYNDHSQTVLSGEVKALQAMATLVSRHGGQAVMLSEQGPWHSPLMNEARERFFDALCCVDFRPPRVPLYLNTTGALESDPDSIAAEVLVQMTLPVRWMQTLAGMAATSTRTFFEVSPGNVLQGSVRRPSAQEPACMT